jgi:hypothetical protein
LVTARAKWMKQRQRCQLFNSVRRSQDKKTVARIQRHWRLYMQGLSGGIWVAVVQIVDVNELEFGVSVGLILSSLISLCLHVTLSSARTTRSARCRGLNPAARKALRAHLPASPHVRAVPKSCSCASLPCRRTSTLRDDTICKSRYSISSPSRHTCTNVPPSCQHVYTEARCVHTW